MSSSLDLQCGRTRRRAVPGSGACGTQRSAAALVEEYQRTGDRRIRNRVAEAHMDVAEHHVARFAQSGGASPDDLRQTALLAILRAVDRFDPAFGTTFRTFASRTVEGELKRYLRDRTWTVRPPRRIQELHLRTRRASESLAQRLGREPTAGELATELGTDVDAVVDSMEAGRARSPVSIDARPTDDGVSGAPSAGAGGQGPVIDLASIEAGYAAVEDRVTLRSAVRDLDERQRRVLQLRYVEQLTQPEIAERVGLSQSYVSRLLRGGLERLRSELAGG